MEKFNLLRASALPIAEENCDTDQIIPARYLQKPRSDNFGEYLFKDLRFTSSGEPDPNFILNDPRYRSAKVLVGGINFGCGSSREHAVWALYDYGFRAAIAPSFGDIFANNCLKNGLVPIVLEAPVANQLLTKCQESPEAEILIDLPEQIVTLPDGSHHPFEINRFAKSCLIEGLDELDYTLRNIDRIKEFERNT